MISEIVSKKVLTVGEKYQDHRGGIAAVINTYSQYFPTFKFVSTFKPIKYKAEMVLHFLKGTISLIKTLNSDKEISIVHIHGAAKGSVLRKYVIFLISKNIYNKKVIYHSHGSEFKKFYTSSPGILKKLIKNFLNSVDLVICLSTQWKIFFEENFDVKELVVLENIVNRPVITGKNERQILSVLFLGYIGKRKGIYDLLDVIIDNKTHLDECMQLIIGGNGEVDKLKNIIDNNNLQSIVKYAGWVSGELKQSVLNEADIYILPSYNEGLPISILEAMSYNLPVISTPVGGITEVVHHNINGFIIDPGDKSGLFNALNVLIQQPQLIKSMGNKSTEIVGPYYAENVIPKLESIYKKLLCTPAN
jgi:glycosyltransferase involved in cell wall biosynthesis